MVFCNITPVLITFPLSGYTITKCLLIQIGLNKNKSKTTKFLDLHPPVNLNVGFA